MQQEEQFIFLLFHFAGFFVVHAFVIVTDKMEKPVNYQKIHILPKGEAIGQPLPVRRFHGNDDVPNTCGDI